MENISYRTNQQSYSICYKVDANHTISETYSVEVDTFNYTGELFVAYSQDSVTLIVPIKNLISVIKTKDRFDATR